ncbi:MAG: hypothetical protein WC152_07310 [Candidatus Izemoplasmatales bacterium]
MKEKSRKLIDLLRCGDHIKSSNVESTPYGYWEIYYDDKKHSQKQQKLF